MTETRLSEKDAEIFRDLLSRDRICIYMHRSPDGDTLGSALALEKVLKNAGKRVCIACSDIVPRRLHFITDGVSAFEPAFEPLVKVSIDVASEKLLGERYENEASTFDFCIDHHYTNTHYAKKTVVCPEASSTGEVLFMLLEQTGTPIDGKTAEYLYTAIAFDTGCFKFSNVRPQTHIAAAKLLSFGIDSADINRKLFDVAPMKQLLLEKTVIDNIRVYLDGKVSLCCITQDMLKGLGLEDSETDGMTNVVRRLEGSVVSVTMRQLSDGTIRVSLRSECDFNVADVAAAFGGGGHVRAAGCSVSGEPAEAIDRIISVISEKWNAQKK